MYAVVSVAVKVPNCNVSSLPFHFLQGSVPSIRKLHKVNKDPEKALVNVCNPLQSLSTNSQNAFLPEKIKIIVIFFEGEILLK